MYSLYTLKINEKRWSRPKIFYRNYWTCKVECLMMVKLVNLILELIIFEKIYKAVNNNSTSIDWNHFQWNNYTFVCTWQSKCVFNKIRVITSAWNAMFQYLMLFIFFDIVVSSADVVCIHRNGVVLYQNEIS